MLIFETVTALQAYLDTQRSTHHIAFVPTMGALHDGHLELIRNAKSKSETLPICTVCSIFVNPTQFGDPKDLEKYPRTVESDAEMLRTVGCDVLFLPSVAEVYPADWETPKFDFGALATVMEGASRIGHFAGVGQVVHRLLSIVQPQSLYLGQKDYQQVAIIRDMVERQLGWAFPRIEMVPIVREPDGLAMSSRNVRLSTAGRRAAAGISQTLFAAQKQAEKADNPAQIRDYVLQQYAQLGFDVDYVSAANAKTLMPVDTWATDGVVLCVVVRIDGVRLLDNIILR
jgi:pantoate--beta-alanine ligase